MSMRRRPLEDMPAAKFKQGDRVYYPHVRKTGTIQRIINAKDADDIRRQGYRYEVSFRGADYVWSVVESSLRPGRDQTKQQNSTHE
jgi:hypothetical protein